MIDITDYILIKPEDYDEHFQPDAELDPEVREAMFRGLFHPIIGRDKNIVRFIKIFRKRKIHPNFADEYANFFILHEEEFEEELGRIQDCLNDIEKNSDQRIEIQQEIESEFRSLEKEIEKLRDQIDGLDSDYEYYEDDKESYEKEIKDLSDEISELEEKYDELRGEIEELEDDKKEAEAVEKELLHYDMRV